MKNRWTLVIVGACILQTAAALPASAHSYHRIAREEAKASYDRAEARRDAYLGRDTRAGIRSFEAHREEHRARKHEFEYPN